MPFGGLAGLAPFIGPAVNLAGAFMQGRQRNNPAEAGMQHLNRIPQYGYNAYNPFINAAAAQEPRLRGQYENMAYNPVDVLRGFESQYQERPGYRYMFDKLNKHAGNTAAAGGFLGTDEDVRNRSEMHAGLLDTYMQQYLNNVFNLQSQGLGGLEQRAGRGFDASSRLADYLGGVSGTQAEYAGYGAQHRGENQQRTWGALSDLINTGVRHFGGNGNRGGA